MWPAYLECLGIELVGSLALNLSVAVVSKNVVVAAGSIATVVVVGELWVVEQSAVTVVVGVFVESLVAVKIPD